MQVRKSTVPGPSITTVTIVLSETECWELMNQIFAYTQGKDKIGAAWILYQHLDHALISPPDVHVE